MCGTSSFGFFSITDSVGLDVNNEIAILGYLENNDHIIVKQSIHYIGGSGRGQRIILFGNQVVLFVCMLSSALTDTDVLITRHIQGVSSLHSLTSFTPACNNQIN